MNGLAAVDEPGGRGFFPTTTELWPQGGQGLLPWLDAMGSLLDSGQ